MRNAIHPVRIERYWIPEKKLGLASKRWCKILDDDGRDIAHVVRTEYGVHVQVVRVGGQPVTLTASRGASRWEHFESLAAVIEPALKLYRALNDSQPADEPQS